MLTAMLMLQTTAVAAGQGVLPHLTISDATIREGNAGTKYLTFTVSLASPSASTVTVTYTTANGTALAALTATYSNASPISIPVSGIASPYPSPITVPPGLGSVGHLAVVLNGFSHAWPEDVDMLLVGPTGQRVMLISDGGVNVKASNLTLTIDDSGPELLGRARLSSGTFKPANLAGFLGDDAFASPAPGDQYSSTLAAFNGTESGGQWRLFVRDDFTGHGGSLAGGWSLIVTTAGPEGDYVPLSGTLTYPPGSTTQTLSVPIIGDMNSEASETFNIILISASGADIVDGEGIGLIQDDDVVTFTDASLSGVPIKAVHIMELRALVNERRAARGLMPFGFTDQALAGTTIKAIHIAELRTALADVYVAAGQPPPIYPDATLTSTTIKAAHIIEIRENAVTAP